MERVTRRGAIKALGTAAAVPVFRLKAEATGSVAEVTEDTSRGFRLQAEDLDAAALAAIAEVVLPADADRKAAIAAFARWVAEYKAGADTDHGYGNTRVRATGPSPAQNYPAQIAALESAARRQNADGFARAPLSLRRGLIEAAIAEAKIERLPARPTGGHIATDLMGHYFNSSAASDLCYQAQIGRDLCRGLPGSEKAPSPLPPRGGSHGGAR